MQVIARPGGGSEGGGTHIFSPVFVQIHRVVVETNGGLSPSPPEPSPVVATVSAYALKQRFLIGGIRLHTLVKWEHNLRYANRSLDR